MSFPLKDTDSDWLSGGDPLLPMKTPTKAAAISGGYDPDLYCDLCNGFSVFFRSFLPGSQTSERNLGCSGLANGNLTQHTIPQIRRWDVEPSTPELHGRQAWTKRRVSTTITSMCPISSPLTSISIRLCSHADGAPSHRKCRNVIRKPLLFESTRLEKA